MLLHARVLLLVYRSNKILIYTFFFKLNICFLFSSAKIPESQMMQTFITHHMKHLSILPGGEDHLGLQARLEEEAMGRHCAASTRRNEGVERM